MDKVGVVKIFPPLTQVKKNTNNKININNIKLEVHDAYKKDEN